MSFSPVPEYSFKRLEDVTAEFLTGKGIKLLMLDLDNTIAPYGVTEPPESIALWAKGVKRAGIELYIVSNSKRPGRTEGFAKALNIGYIKAAGKPRPDACIKVVSIKKLPPESCALAGDQIYTDVLAANSAGVHSIVVKPIKFTNPFLRLRYWAEAPFRLACRNKAWR